MAGTSSTASDGGPPGEIMLFGVRVVVDSMRKSVSLNNLSQYQHPSDLVAVENNASDDQKEKDKEDVVAVAAAGYASADDAVHHSPGSRSERKRAGIPWTEDEHKLFLIGLQKVGKGDWRGISRNFVKTRTPTQVASHAQKYFLRRLNLNRRRRRSSLFDITTDTVAGVSMEEEESHFHNQENKKKKMPSPSPPAEPTTNIMSCFPVMPAFTISTTNPPIVTEMPMDNLSLRQGIHCNIAPVPLPVPVAPSSSLSRTSSRTISDVDLNLNSNSADGMSLALNLSLPSDQRMGQQHNTVSFKMIHSLGGNGDNNSTISVA
ncbi:Transcription factor MYB1R1 [Linum grandiflorum]